MMEFTFEDSLWEQTLNALPQGGSLSAAQFLTLMEGQSEDALEDAFALLIEKQAELELTTLPAFAAQGQAAVRLRQEQQIAQKADMRAGLEENDPLRVYLEELAMLPAAGDIRLLAEQHLEGDESASRKLVELSLSRVVELARDFVGYGVLLLDLIQEGSMGLWQGIGCYEGGNFESHRDWWIRHAMTRAVLEQALNTGIGQKLRQAMADYRDTDQRLLAELGRNPTLEEIAESMHMTPAQVAVVAEMVENARVLHRAKNPENTEQMPEEEDQAVEDTAYFQMRQRIAELLSGLSEADAKLLTLRYGLEGGVPLNPQQTGARLGLTPEEVIARETAALSKLRTQ